MKRFIGLVGGLLLFGGLVAGAPPAHAVYTCPNTPSSIANTTINDSVVVPTNSNCVIDNSTIKGSVTVQQGGSLELRGSTVNGSVYATNAPRFVILRAICPGGPPCARTTLVTGSLNVTGVQEQSSICDGSEVRSGVYIRNSGPNGSWGIGAQNPCFFGNTFGSSMTLTGNQAPIDVEFNTFRGGVTSTGNTGSGSIIDNGIAGSLYVNSCPPWTIKLNQVAGSTTVAACV